MTLSRLTRAWWCGVAVAAHLASTVASCLVAFLAWSFVPGTPGYEPCGLQGLLVMPLSVAMLVLSIPAVVADDRLGVHRMVKWSCPGLAVTTWLIDPFFGWIELRSLAALVTSFTLLAFGGMAAVACLVIWRIRCERLSA